MLLALLAACASDESAPAAPSAWSWIPPAADPPALDASGVEAAVEETIAVSLATRARTVTDAFDAAMAHREEGCPDYESNGPQTAVSGDCTTSDGWGWYGTGQLSHIRDFHIVLGDIDAWHRVWDYSTGNVRVVGPDTSYALLGYAWYRDYDTDEGARAIRSELWGQFGVTDPAFGDSWIATDRGVEMQVELVEGPDGWDGTWNVGISRLDGVAWAYVWDFALAATCPTEPVGTVRVQDQAGDWYTVRFDGDCDGCGESEVGTVCADFSALAAFEGDPWG